MFVVSIGLTMKKQFHPTASHFKSGFNWEYGNIVFRKLLKEISADILSLNLNYSTLTGMAIRFLMC